MTIRRVMWVGMPLMLMTALELGAQTATFEGTAVTGINRRLGAPLFSFGAPFGTIGFETVGGFNPGGADATALTPATPLNTLLATTVDPGFLAVFGVAGPDPARLNVPLRDVVTMTSPDGSGQTIAGLLASPQFSVSRAPSNGRITLRSWLRASGEATIRCSGPNSPRVELRFTGLIPRGLYSVWGGMLTPDGPAPIPLGGLPNVFVAADEGRASFDARLNYCPLALRPGEFPLAFIDVVLHTDYALYGGVPEPFAAGLPPGVVSHIHVEFPITASPLP